MIQRVLSLRCASSPFPSKNTFSEAYGDKKNSENREFMQGMADWIRGDDFDLDGLRRVTSRFRGDSSTKAEPGTRRWFGIPEDSIEMHVLKKTGSHEFNVCPVIREKSAFMRSQVHKHYPGPSTPITINKIENSRAQVDALNKKDMVSFIATVKYIQMEYLSAEFQKPSWDLNYRAIERMFSPKYTPAYREVLDAFKLPPSWLYVPEEFHTLENIARFPLSRVDQQKGSTLHLSFEEWHSLFMNYYITTHPLHYFLQVTGNTLLYTTEFISSFAEYLRDRCKRIGNTTKPIVDILSPTGKLAYLLNKTERIPVPVIACTESLTRNPYLLKIPRPLQSEFDIPPPRSLDIPAALEKYQPNIVICQDMPINKDFTRQFRAEGSVLEYILLGVPYSYISGHPWFTWGLIGNKPDDDKSEKPHHIASGYFDRKLNHLSRWLIGAHDSHIATGFPQVVSFSKEQFQHTWKDRCAFFFKQVQPS